MLAKFFHSTFSPAEDKQEEKYEKEIADQLLLPGDLAGRILDMEIECQGENISKILLGKLITLYTSAIQYYESINSEKYKIYKKRLQIFLSKPSVQSVLQGADGSLSIKRQMVQKTRLHATISTKQQIVKIIQKCDKRADSNQKILKKQIQSQNTALQARIERRKSMSNKSTKADNQNQGMNKLLNQKLNVNLFVNGIKNRAHKKVFF